MFCFTVPFSKSRFFYQALSTIEFNLQVVNVFRDDFHRFLIVSLHFRPCLDCDTCIYSFRIFRDALGFYLDNVCESSSDQKS